jgi:hypothetical protein
MGFLQLFGRRLGKYAGRKTSNGFAQLIEALKQVVHSNQFGKCSNPSVPVAANLDRRKRAAI